MPLLFHPGVPALFRDACVVLGLRTGSQRGVWRTVGPCSCPATQQTPPRMCCSGSWKVNGRAGTSLTGEQRSGIYGLFTAETSQFMSISFILMIPVSSFPFLAPRAPRSLLEAHRLKRTRGAAVEAVATYVATSQLSHLSKTLLCLPCPLPTLWPNWRRPAVGLRRCPPSPLSKGTERRERAPNLLSCVGMTCIVILNPFLKQSILFFISSQAFIVQSSAGKDPPSVCPGWDFRPSSQSQPSRPRHDQPQPPIRRVRCL